MNVVKYLGLLTILLFIDGGCKTKKEKEETIIDEQEGIQKGLQEQLDKEFGEYVDNVNPEDREYYAAYNKALTLWGTPFHELYINTSFGNAHAIVSGPKDAEPLVLLHGMNASSTMWYPNAKALSQKYRVYAIDYLLEPGKSQMTRKVKGMVEIMEWYNEIFDQLKLEKFSLIGASEGGWLALNIALHQNARVRNLILLSPLQTFMWIRPGSKMSSDIFYALVPKRKHLRGVLETMSMNVDKIDNVYIDQYFIATQKAKTDLMMFQMTPFSDDQLRSLAMPVLVLIGDHDIINKEKGVKKAKELLPHAETGIVKNAGHFLSMDQADAINTWILNFMNRNPISVH